MKITTRSRTAYVGPRHQLSLGGNVSTSMEGSHRRRLHLFLLVGWRTWSLDLHFGRRKGAGPAPFATGDVVECADDEEACQLQEGRLYEVRELHETPSRFDDEAMEWRVGIGFGSEERTCIAGRRGGISTSIAEVQSRMQGQEPALLAGSVAVQETHQLELLLLRKSAISHGKAQERRTQGCL